MTNLDHGPTPAGSTVMAITNLPSGPDDSISKVTGGRSAPLHPEKEIATEVLVDIQLEKPAKSAQGDAFQLIHSSRSNVTFSVKAGYRRIWDEQSMLSKISGGHQETGCAYLGANISF